MMVLDLENLKDAKITLTLIFINILLFIFINFAPPEIFQALVQDNRRIIENFEIWRLFTSIFIHADPIHLFSNMIALLLFGATVEINHNITQFQYIFIYIASGLIGSFFSLLLIPIVISLDIISLGASGAIFGLIGVAFIIVAIEYRPLLFLALFYLGFFILTSFSPGINYWAHIFGLVGGILFGYLFYMRKRKIQFDY